MLPFSEACERNKHPILEVLAARFSGPARVLEIGSGTGQHAVHFARHLPQLTWQPSEHPDALAGLRARVSAEPAPNLLDPIPIDVDDASQWPSPGAFDAVFTANTLHIMGWPSVVQFFECVGRLLGPAPSARLVVYGAFKYRGQFTTPSNATFDQMLRERDARSGLRDFEAVQALAVAAGLDLEDDLAMPANNQLVLWRRGPGA